MTSRDFAFWLQGFFEITEGDERNAGRGLSPAQAETVRRHLALVFKHEIDPSMKEPEPKTAHEAKLDEAHSPFSPPPPHTTGGPVYRC